MAKLADRVSLSLDGSTPAVLTKMRQDGRMLKKVLGVLGTLRAQHTEVSVKTLVTKVNAEDIVNIGKLLEPTGILTGLCLSLVQ